MKAIQRLNVSVDLAGCPNRCRHCWLGAHEGTQQTPAEAQVDRFVTIAEAFRAHQDHMAPPAPALSFASWWREPDLHPDYPALWALEQRLSDPGEATRFELLSVWRAARDDAYLPWLKTLPPRAYQLTFFGLEANTDWFFRRKGAFADNLRVTARLIEHGLAPRWQLFITKRCLAELDAFMALMRDLQLWERCRAQGLEFTFFLGGISPEGNGLAIEPLRLEADDLARIPKDMIAYSRDGTDLLGEPASRLYEALRARSGPPGQAPNVPSLFITMQGDVYPNIAGPAPWLRLGNLNEGVDTLWTRYQGGSPPGMWANEHLPVSELAARYGDPNDTRLYTPDDLIALWMVRWGRQWIAENGPKGLTGGYK